MRLSITQILEFKKRVNNKCLQKIKINSIKKVTSSKYILFRVYYDVCVLLTILNKFIVVDFTHI